MAVIRLYTSPTAKRPRFIGTLPMPDGSHRRFKGHDAAEVCQRWEAACEAMKATMQRKAAKRIYMRDYASLRRETLAAHGICQNCGQADSEPGRTLCWRCRLYRNQRRSGAQSAPRIPYKDGRRAG